MTYNYYLSILNFYYAIEIERCEIQLNFRKNVIIFAANPLSRRGDGREVLNHLA